MMYPEEPDPPYLRAFARLIHVLIGYALGVVTVYVLICRARC